MVEPRIEAPVRDDAPGEPSLTAYDRRHLITYLRLLDAAAADADWREVARVVLGLDPEREPERARGSGEAVGRQARSAAARAPARPGAGGRCRRGHPARPPGALDARPARDRRAAGGRRRRSMEEGGSVLAVVRTILECHPATLYRELGKLNPPPDSAAAPAAR
jgi:hypothetical protein